MQDRATLASEVRNEASFSRSDLRAPPVATLKSTPTLAQKNILGNHKMNENDGAPSYIDVVDKFDGTWDERNKLVRVVHSIMENFVDRAFGIDAVQQIESNSAISSIETSDTFGRRTHERRSRKNRSSTRAGGRRAGGNRHMIKGGENKCKKRA